MVAGVYVYRVDRASVEKDRAEPEILFMDLGLMAQTVVKYGKSDKPDAESDEPRTDKKGTKEKIERFRWGAEVCTGACVAGGTSGVGEIDLARLLIEATSAVGEEKQGDCTEFCVSDLSSMYIRRSPHGP